MSKSKLGCAALPVLHGFDHFVLLIIFLTRIFVKKCFVDNLLLFAKVNNVKVRNDWSFDGDDFATTLLHDLRPHWLKLILSFDGLRYDLIHPWFAVCVQLLRLLAAQACSNLALLNIFVDLLAQSLTEDGECGRSWPLGRFFRSGIARRAAWICIRLAAFEFDSLDIANCLVEHIRLRPSRSHLPVLFTRLRSWASLALPLRLNITFLSFERLHGNSRNILDWVVVLRYNCWTRYLTLYMRKLLSLWG